jgi:hypothetical protein
MYGVHCADQPVRPILPLFVFREMVTVGADTADVVLAFYTWNATTPGVSPSPTTRFAVCGEFVP